MALRMATSATVKDALRPLAKTLRWTRSLDIDLSRQPLDHRSIKLHRIGIHGACDRIELDDVDPALGSLNQRDKLLVFANELCELGLRQTSSLSRGNEYIHKVLVSARENRFWHDRSPILSPVA